MLFSAFYFILFYYFFFFFFQAEDGIRDDLVTGVQTCALPIFEYFTLPVRSLLNRCTSARMPFAWTINPYRGCEFACKYCYARYTHEFMEMRDGIDFEQKIYIKQHAANLLRQELRLVRPGQEISIGTAPDPYPPAP